jgi:hypothetical protein
MAEVERAESLGASRPVLEIRVNRKQGILISLVLISVFLSVFITLDRIFLEPYAQEFFLGSEGQGIVGGLDQQDIDSMSRTVQYFGVERAASIIWLASSILVWAIALGALYSCFRQRIKFTRLLMWLSAAASLFLSVSFVFVSDGLLFIPSMLLVAAALWAYMVRMDHPARQGSDASLLN